MTKTLEHSILIVIITDDLRINKKTTALKVLGGRLGSDSEVVQEVLVSTAVQGNHMLRYLKKTAVNKEMLLRFISTARNTRYTFNAPEDSEFGYRTSEQQLHPILHAVPSHCVTRTLCR